MEKNGLKRGTRVLVTGGAGFIGSHLVEALVRQECVVRVLDDLSTGKPERLATLPIELLQGDIRNPAAVRRAMLGVERVYHLAGVRLRRDDDDGRALWRAQEVNVGGTLNLLDAARRGVDRPHLVLMGSGEVYGRAPAYLLHEEVPPLPVTPEGVQRLAIENYARLYWEVYGVPTVLLRVFGVFGPGEPLQGPGLVPRLCMAALSGLGPTVSADPHRNRDLVYIDNVVGALLRAASAPGVEGQVFNIASGETTTWAAVWQTLCELGGGSRCDLVYEPTHAAPELVSARVSIARACRSLGYTPAVRLRSGLRQTLAYYEAEWPRAAVQSHPYSWFAPHGDGNNAEEPTTDVQAALGELAPEGAHPSALPPPGSTGSSSWAHRAARRYLKRRPDASSEPLR